MGNSADVVLPRISDASGRAIADLDSNFEASILIAEVNDEPQINLGIFSRRIRNCDAVTGTGPPGGRIPVPSLINEVWNHAGPNVGEFLINAKTKYRRWSASCPDLLLNKSTATDCDQPGACAVTASQFLIRPRKSPQLICGSSLTSAMSYRCSQKFDPNRAMRRSTCIRDPAKHHIRGSLPIRAAQG